MKQRLCILFVFILLIQVFSFGVYAEEEAETAAETETAAAADPQDQAEIARRGLEAIQATGYADIIVLPKEESYLAEWKVGYARKAFKAPSLKVERISQLQTGRLTMPYVCEGVKAISVAEENDMSCILYYGVNNKLYVGWIQTIRLLDEFPGETYTIGTAPEKDCSCRDDITVSWSEHAMPGTQQLYTVFSEPLENCLGFTLEYQIIKENTPYWDSILGPRKIYVRSGGEWLEVGEFPYPEFGAVRAQIYFQEPMDIDAVGTLAQCRQPNIFNYRQTAFDFLF